MLQEAQHFSTPHEHQQHQQTAKTANTMAPLANAEKMEVVQKSGAGNLKGSHSALVKLLESAPIAQVKPILKHKLNGGRTDQNHYRKGGDQKGPKNCPWKSRICAEWLMKNQQAAAAEEEPQKAQTVMVVASDNSKATAPSLLSTLETETKPKGGFLSPPTAAQHTTTNVVTEPSSEDDVEMVDLDGLVCTCHELQQNKDLSGEEEPLRRFSSDSTDDDELLPKCDCGHCAMQKTAAAGVSPAMLLSEHRAPPSVSDSGCEDSDCQDNKIQDLCNRFNENLSKDDVSLGFVVTFV